MLERMGAKVLEHNTLGGGKWGFKLHSTVRHLSTALKVAWRRARCQVHLYQRLVFSLFKCGRSKSVIHIFSCLFKMCMRKACSSFSFFTFATNLKIAFVSVSSLDFLFFESI